MEGKKKEEKRGKGGEESVEIINNENGTVLSRVELRRAGTI